MVMGIDKFQKIKKYKVDGIWVETQIIQTFLPVDYRNLEADQIPDEAVEEYLVEKMFNINEVESIKQYMLPDEVEDDENYTFVQFYNGMANIVAIPYKEFSKLLKGRKTEMTFRGN